MKEYRRKFADVVKWIELAQYSNPWRALGKTVLKLKVA